MNQEISAILKDDYLYMLESIAQKDPAGFKESVMSVTDGNSLFISFFKKSNNLENVKGVLDLFKKYGYSLEAENKVADSSIRKVIENYNEEKIPDLLYALKIGFAPQTADFLLRQVSPEYLLSLEKRGWPLFRMMAENRYIAAAQYLVDIGCDVNFTGKEGQTPLSYIDRDKAITDIYWSAVNKKENLIDGMMPFKEFEHFSTILVKKINAIYGSKNAEVDAIIELVKEKKDRFDDIQKFSILRKSLDCRDKKLFKGLLKVFELKIKDPKVSDFLLKNLRASDQMEYCYMFLDKKSLLKNLEDMELREIVGSPDTKEPCGFKSVNDILSSQMVSLSCSRANRSKTDKFNVAVMTRLKENLKSEGYDFLFQKVDGHSLNVFETITKKKHNTFSLNHVAEIINVSATPNAVFNFKNIDKPTWDNFIKNDEATLNDIQKEEVRYLLDKTWLKKDEFGHPYMTTHHPAQFMRNPLHLLHNKVLLEVLNKSEKADILGWCINNIKHLRHSYSIDELKKNNSDEMSFLFRKIYDEFKSDKSFDWNTVNIKPENLDEIKNTEIYFEIKALMMYSDIASNIKPSSFPNSSISKKIKL